MEHAAKRPAVRVEHDFRAAPAKVFDAWLDPALVARWMAPGAVRAEVAIDPRLGGRYRVIHLEADKPVGGFDASIVLLDRPNRLIFAWGMIGPDGDEAQRFDSRLTLTFTPTPTGTRLLLVHEELDAFAASLPEIADLIGVGWAHVFDKLQAIIG